MLYQKFKFSTRGEVKPRDFFTTRLFKLINLKKSLGWAYCCLFNKVAEAKEIQVVEDSLQLLTKL